MPPKSEAQRRFMHAQAKPGAGGRARKVPLKVAQEYAQSDKGGKLPERASKKGRRR